MSVVMVKLKSSFRVVLTTLALMLTCVNCEGEGAGEVEYVLSVHNKMSFLWQKHGYYLSLLSFCLLYLFYLASLLVGFGSFAVLGCKDL